MNLIEQLRESGDKLLDNTFLPNASKVGYVLRETGWNPKDTWVSMRGKICVVTGANSGLGKTVSMRLAALGARVYLACRNVERGNRARQHIVSRSQTNDVLVEVVDVSQPHSIRAFVERLQAKEA